MLTHQLSSRHQTALSYPSSSVPRTQCFEIFIAKNMLLLLTLMGALTLHLGQNIILLAFLHIRSLLQLNCTLPIALSYFVAKFNEKSLYCVPIMNPHPYGYVSLLSFLHLTNKFKLDLRCSCLLGWPCHLLRWGLWTPSEGGTWEHGAVPQLLACKPSKSRLPSALDSALPQGHPFLQYCSIIVCHFYRAVIELYILVVPTCRR